MDDHAAGTDHDTHLGEILARLHLCHSTWRRVCFKETCMALCTQARAGLSHGNFDAFFLFGLRQVIDIGLNLIDVSVHSLFICIRKICNHFGPGCLAQRRCTVAHAEVAFNRPFRKRLRKAS